MSGKPGQGQRKRGVRRKKESRITAQKLPRRPLKAENTGVEKKE